MHELSVMQSILDAITEKMGEAQVSVVSLEIGALSGVVPDALRFCFDVVCLGTTLEGARLDIEQPRGRARCHDCAADFALDDPIPLCACGSANVQITEGKELRIRSVEVV